MPAGFATLFPAARPCRRPATSTSPRHVAPNAFTVGLGADGSFNLYSNSGGNFIIDITGYYDTVPTDGLLFHPLPRPVRVLDTRASALGGRAAWNAADARGTLNLPGPFTHDGVSVPGSASALVGNATVDNTSNAPAGFATLYPAGAPLPLASNLNYSPGLVAPNAFIVGLGANDSYNLYSQSGSDFIIDISGYFS